ncbi:MAG: dTMP kinase [Candidatus Thermofonsia Clade 3 bacterium]|uniref:Thymidylate kinase n=1 Tax=Candidatus Thermofonsia Clade 3 bacterium TaxID=2364212 RepID=A0A2M8QCR3_9CHLR|nr:MAG: dTMP kinase [Candidatus Thermofonsia Clade 3 bacterium]
MFISFEGLDGSGKTTQVQRLAVWLRTHHRHVLTLREPGGTKIGDAIRAILHDRSNSNMDSRAELLLYCASRAQLVAEQVRPYLRSGGIVLSDRFADSTLAYQGYGRGLDLDFLRSLLDFVTQGIKPDLTLYFDVDPERALERRMASGAEVNRMDVETIEFHHRVREGYHRLIAQEPERWRVIDASATTDQVAAQVQDIVKTRLNIAD